jgi:probable HAF family extracellular repeat protein
LAFGETCAEAQSYTAVDLDPQTTYIEANGVNNAGTIVGVDSFADGQRAFIFSNGVMTELGTLGGPFSQANGINNAGTVTGYSLTAADTYHAFSYSGGVMTDLGTLGGTSSWAYAINDAGTVVGWSTDAIGRDYAFSYSGGAMTNLGWLSTISDSDSSVAYGINNAGTIVGTSGGNSASHAFIYSNGSMTDIGTLGVGASWSYAYAINNAGTVVGYSLTANNNSQHAFIYSGGVMTDLGTLGGPASYAYAINNAGAIVGMAQDASYSGRAFIDIGGKMTDLNTLVELPGVTLINATGINDNGQIIAAGDNNHCYLLTPIPPRLINLSCRAQVGTGGNILIAGFVIGGSGTESLLIRAGGPGLTPLGVPGALTQPSLSVFDNTGRLIASNTGWGNNANPAQIASIAAQVGAFAFTSGSADCAVIVDLPAGAYTVEVSGVNNTTGVALVEVYEVSSSGTRLINISTRAPVGTGANILIPGFVIKGTGSEQLLVRGDGPSLTAFGVTGALAQPSLSVFSGQTVIASNTGWGTSTNPTPAQIASIAAQVGAFPFVSGSADSATIVSLTPGAYTMQVSGVGNTTGDALAEVYEVP